MYSPGFITSLIGSSSSPEFYSRIKDISLKRAVGFLLLLSLLVSLVFFVLTSLYFSKHQVRSEEILGYYDQHLPDFEVILSEGRLETIPSDFSYYFTIDENQELRLQKEQLTSSIFTVQVDTQKTREQLLALPPELSGIYVLQDAMVLFTGIQNTVVEYASLQIPEGIAFSKNSIRPLLEQHLPAILEWARRVALQLGTALVFFYTFISSWILALISSVFGLLILLIRQKPIQYSFLIKLSFYAMVPALLIMLLTHLFSISVAFLPFIIYLCFYYYGLMVYEGKS
ncbi:MAG: DUF1189 family protein [Candidatus Altimarinota bacterium]